MTKRKTPLKMKSVLDTAADAVPSKSGDELKPSEPKRKRQIVRPFRTTKFMQERSSLLRCLLQDARLQRCVQLVS